MRSPRFRRVPFIRNGVSDHGRAVAPRMTVRNMLPSTLSTVSASAILSLSRLNVPLHMIVQGIPKGLFTLMVIGARPGAIAMTR